MAKANRICEIDGCNKSHRAKGLCAMHYRRKQVHGDVHALMRAPNGAGIQFIQELVENPPDVCVVWPYGKLTCGYGSVETPSGSVPAHRVALKLYAGPPPDGKPFALHGPCHNRACVNPKHIHWGCNYENQADRLRDKTSNRGEQHHASKLTKEDVLAIRIDKRRNFQVAKIFGVSRQTVHDIRERLTWSWLK